LVNVLVSLSIIDEPIHVSDDFSFEIVSSSATNKDDRIIINVTLSRSMIDEPLTTLDELLFEITRLRETSIDDIVESRICSRCGEHTPHFADLEVNIGYGQTYQYASWRCVYCKRANYRYWKDSNVGLLGNEPDYGNVVREIDGDGNEIESQLNEVVWVSSNNCNSEMKGLQELEIIFNKKGKMKKFPCSLRVKSK